MKDIKDYLHLYLGCKLLRTDYKKVFTPSSIVMWFEKAMDTELFKLILRPLSSMTGKEKEDLGMVADSTAWVEGLKNGVNQSYRLTPERVLYLLSKHFDLFGLIESGLAIDSTTLKPTL